MGSGSPFLPEEFDDFMDLTTLLTQSLNIHKALQEAYPFLCRLIPVDHGSMCISRVHDVMQYDWSVVELPEGFFRNYHEIASYDFVRLAVAKKPNFVVCDDEMLPPDEREQLERQPMVQLAWEYGMRIEQIMAVMIKTDVAWTGGMTLYRDRPVAFTPREQAKMQRLLPIIGNIMQNCRTYVHSDHWAHVLELGFKMYGTTTLEFSPSLQLINTTPDYEYALNRCFGRQKRGPHGVPRKLFERLQDVRCKYEPGTVPEPWIPPEPGSGVVVKFQPLVFPEGTYWMVLLEEVPQRWRDALTKNQLDLALYVAQGWDYMLVAKKFCIKASTIRDHLSNIFDKLHLSGREALIAEFRSRS